MPPKCHLAPVVFVIPQYITRVFARDYSLAGTGASSIPWGAVSGNSSLPRESPALPPSPLLDRGVSRASWLKPPLALSLTRAKLPPDHWRPAWKLPSFTIIPGKPRGGTLGKGGLGYRRCKRSGGTKQWSATWKEDSTLTIAQSSGKVWKTWTNMERLRVSTLA